MEDTTVFDEIKFHNSYMTHLSGYCRECDFKSLGSVLHHIHIYSKRVDFASTVKVGVNKVYYGENLIATFELDYGLQIPIFTFVDEYDDLRNAQENYLHGMKKVYTGKEVLALELICPSVRVLEFPISERYCHKGKIGTIHGKDIFVGAFFPFDARWKVQLV